LSLAACHAGRTSIRLPPHRLQRKRRPTSGIAITAADAIAATLPLGSVGFERSPLTTASGWSGLRRRSLRREAQRLRAQRG
jgi:hypothetical protein